jgi:hypothetical protein
MLPLRPAHRVRAYRPRFEVLEGRNLLSPYVVDRLTDSGAGSGLAGDLRYCIDQAADGDAITFDVTGTINLTGALPDLTHSIDIEGPGAAQLTVRRNTGGNYRIFTVDSGTTVSISGLTITNGFVIGAGFLAGGGILNGGTLTVSNCTISGNKAGQIGGDNGSGGGIANFGTLTLSNSTVAGNDAYGGNAGAGDDPCGGGIFNDFGTLTVNNGTISGNTVLWHSFDDAGGNGGGICNEYGTVTISNSTVSGNSAPAGYGGGIYNDDYGTLTLNNATVSGNSAGYDGGGIVNGIESGGALHARNTIIAGNTNYYGDPDDLIGNLGSLGHNLIGNTNGGSGFDPTDLLNVDPRLGPLQDNGGPTQTIALLPGSPAINAGDNTNAPIWDQRGPGFPRIIHGTIDIGAFEYRAPRQLDPNPVPISEPGPGPDLRQGGLPGSQATLELAATTRAMPATDPAGNVPAGGTVAPADGYFALPSEERGDGEANAWVPDLWLNQDRLFA